MKELKIYKPDDWHLHLRDGCLLRAVISDTTKRFSRALLMPNLSPPIINVDLAMAYRDRIIKADTTNTFNPYMSLYMHEGMSVMDIRAAAACEHILSIKLYPANSTTNSSLAIKNIKSTYSLLGEMQRLDLVLNIHGEIADSEIDPFDREARFIEDELDTLVRTFPNLRIVLEHISTKQAVEYIKYARAGVVATITPHHLSYDRRILFSGGIRPHYYCLPILKTKEDRDSIRMAAISGNNKFFLGTDSAPHLGSDKESSCGCAGIYNSHIALELCIEVFEELNALDKLENFTSVFGARFYNLECNKEKISIRKEKWRVQDYIYIINSSKFIVPLNSGCYMSWKVQ